MQKVRQDFIDTWVTGYIPTQDDFKHLFDSYYNKLSDPLGGGWYSYTFSQVDGSYINGGDNVFSIPPKESKMTKLRLFGIGQPVGALEYDINVILLYITDQVIPGYIEFPLIHSIFSQLHAYHFIGDFDPVTNAHIPQVISNITDTYDQIIPIDKALQYTNIQQLWLTLSLTDGKFNTRPFISFEYE